MAHAYHHALSSARRFGGVPEDYLAIHQFLDSSKIAWADSRHRAVLHHCFGIDVVEEVVGRREEVRLLRDALRRVPRWLLRLLGVRVPGTTPVTVPTSTGRPVPIRTVAEQHIQEDCGFVPTVADYLRETPKTRWMALGASPFVREVLPALEAEVAP